MKIIVLIVAFMTMFLILNMLYKRTNHYKNTTNQLQKYFKGVPNDLEIVNTGSSYARYAFDYSNKTLNGFNFGLQPQSLSYDFRIINQYTTKLAKGCVVLITLPDLVFCFLDYNYDYNNTKYYYFLEPKNIIGFSKLKYLIRIIFPILSNKKNILRIIKDEQPKDPYNQDKNLMTEAQISNDALSRVEGWKKEFNLKNTIDNNIPDELEKIFDATISLVSEMIEYCLEHSFKPVILIPPTSSIINDLLSKEFMKKILYDNIEKANKRKVPILDYLYDERFQDYALYINSDMLNRNGRDKFTQVVFNDLKEIDLIKEKESGQI